MGSKNKTVSFRIDEDAFDALQKIAEERDLSLSALFRDYVDVLIDHDGRVEVVPEGEAVTATDDEGFPPMVEVPKSFVREHERVELEADHLREQLEEYRGYVTHLREQLEETDDVEEVIQLEDLDRERESDRSRYRLSERQ